MSNRAALEPLLELGDQLLLCQDVPARRGGAELAVEPGLLLRSEIAPARVEAFGAGSIQKLLGAAARRHIAGQPRAVLPRVEQQKARQPAEIEAAVDRRVRPVRQRRAR